MALPHSFANETGPIMTELDDNFAALGNIDYIPCTAAGTNAITLTPAANTPSVTQYTQLQGFQFIALSGNTGAVTIAVIGQNGSPLTFLNAYKLTAAGPAALVSGDIRANSYYVAIYDSALNSGNGGFHITPIVSQVVSNVNQGTVFAGPTSATPTAPVFRSLVPGDFGTAGIQAGQVLIGTSASGLVLSAITAGANVAITTGDGQIVINATTSGGTVPIQTVNVQTGLSGGGTATPTVTIGLAGGPVLPQPGGRLTLQQGAPVMTADSTFTSSIFYFPYVSSLVPVSDGAKFIYRQFSSVTVVATTSNQAASSVYDVFAIFTGGGISAGFGPVWGSATARGSGVGTTQITQTSGLWTNTQTITLTNAATILSGIPIGQATLLGSVAFSSSAGLTAMQFKPAAAAGGTNNLLGVWNAYNRVRVAAYSRDSAASWTYGTNTWRNADSSHSNAISWIDGLQQSRVESMYEVGVTTNVGANPSVGVNFNNQSATPNGTVGIAGSGVNGTTLWGYDQTILLGFNYAQAMEISNGGTTQFFGTFNGAEAMALTLSLEM